MRSTAILAVTLALASALTGAAAPANALERQSIGFAAEQKGSKGVRGQWCTGASMCNHFAATCIGGGGDFVPTKYNQQGQPTKGKCN